MVNFFKQLFTTENLESFFKRESVKHSALAFIIFASATIFQWATYKYGVFKADTIITKSLKYAAVFPDTLAFYKSDYREVLFQKRIYLDSAKSSIISYTTLSLPTVVNCKVARIYQQLTDVVLRAHNHLIITKEFMVQSYVCTSTAAVYFIFAGISLAFITKSGFAQANPYFITILICSLGVGSFFIGLANIYNQEKNAKDNLGLYVKYINLEQEIRSKLVTDKNILSFSQTKCDTISNSLDDTIGAIDIKMREINGIAMGFNQEVVRSLTKLGLEDETLETQ